MYRLAIAFGLLAAVSAIPIDNGITGDPEIECGPTSIQVTFNTQNAFSGHVYVKNRFAEDGCRTTGDNTRSIGQIELDFAACGVARERSAEPKGIFVRSTIVISFHPNFLTKIDRAYTIQCFYMEADKTVSTEIEVSMITTGFQTQVVPMPVCRYEILDAADGNGNPVQFAIIGQAVFHKWTCDTDTIDTFCMVVHSCTVDDGQGDNLQLIDENGCAIDRYLMGNLDYPSDLMASKEVHVFKYADRPALFFNCQITITVKEPNGQCERPECAEPGGQGDGSRRRKRSAEAAAIIDTSSGFETLDISPEAQRDLPGWLSHRQRALEPLYVRPVINSTQQGICMSTAGFTGFVVVAVALVGAVITVASCMLMRNKH